MDRKYCTIFSTKFFHVYSFIIVHDNNSNPSFIDGYCTNSLMDIVQIHQWILYKFSDGYCTNSSMDIVQNSSMDIVQIL